MPQPGASEPLPVLEVLDEVRAALAAPGAAVLVAPPGTGKTTGVPPALLQEPSASTGRVLVLEPRRLAARAAATRMAEMWGEPVGATFGYSVRGERRVGPGTRVEVVTEGLLVRRLQNDPALDGVCAVLLDEFHERSLDTDLALALLLDLRRSLRPDLRLLVMSATLDPAPVATLLGDGPLTDGGGAAPVIRATAPLHPVRTVHRPGSAHDPIEQRVAEVVLEALRSDPGDVLVFLPGRPEIRRTATQLTRLGLPAGVVVRELHGSLSPADQDEVIRPDDRGRRRVVLSTSLAETSITVPGVRVVVDSGRRRTMRTDPHTGLPALVTGPVSRAGADQRTGRAGRTAPGVSYRLWSTDEERHRPAADDPEVLTGDLAAAVLQVRAWGVDDPRSLDWLDPLPEHAVAAATELLVTLGALEPGGRLTALGRELADLGFHPRLAAVASAGRRLGEPELAADLVAVLETARSGPSDVVERIRDLHRGRAGEDLRRAAREWRRTLGGRGGRGGRGSSRGDEHRRAGIDDTLVARLVLAGYPDRVARRRPGRRTDERGREQSVFHLRGGGEVAVRVGDPLAGADWLVLADLDAGPPGAPGRVHLAAAIESAVVLDTLGDAVETADEVAWDRARGDVVARRREALGAITLREVPLVEPDAVAVAAAVRSALRDEGLGLLGRLDEAAALRARVACLRAATGRPGASADEDEDEGEEEDAAEGEWPDWSERALVEHLDEWLGPWLGGVRNRRDLDRVDVRSALQAQLDHGRRRRLDQLAPTQWELASGRRVTLRYGEVDGEPGTVLASVRLRDAIGTDVHPTVGEGRLPVTVELLSPAGRPVQRTNDLPGFWRGSYAAVRSELRGRYPKHPWPDRPWEPLPRRR